MASPHEPSSPGSYPQADLPAPPSARTPARYRRVAPPPSAEQALARRAAEVLRGRGGRPPARWLLPGFAENVDHVRLQLGPLRDQEMLAASFARESAHLEALRRFAIDPSAPPIEANALEAAYAVRWLELSDGGRALPPWATFMSPEAEPAR